LLNSVTARPRPGTQAQNVILVALEEAHELPASTVVPALAAAAALGDFDDDGCEGALLPQPASTATAAAAASHDTPCTALVGLNPGELPGSDDVSANISSPCLSAYLFAGDCRRLRDYWLEVAASITVND
jgi:hypothetical protein